MRLPDATNQIRLAPVRALRAVFSGVGQLLLATDRLREDDARREQESGDNQKETAPTWDGRLSSSVRLISPTGMPVHSSGRPAKGKAANPAARGGKTETAKRASGGKPAGTGTARRPARARNAAEPPRFRSLDFTGNVRMLSEQDIADITADQLGPTTESPTTEPPATELPIGGYDGLSLASLRARLRNLGPAELRDLLAHERLHANREDVVTMFERRIAKLEGS